MKLDASTVTIERGGKFTETAFEIGDSRLIIEMLRKTCYSNPIKSLIQEVMSNGRDAHREVSNESHPIKIHIPNKINPNWTCQDWGPGINPTRMIEVFVKYGNSTKRGTGQYATDNGLKQTGGFGIGCKSPFAYTDSFSIITKAMEGNVLVERTYLAVIAEDNTNKLMELEDSMRIIDPNNSELSEDDKKTGTTIIVPVQDKDFQSFKTYTLEVAKFWNPRPIINDIHDYQWPELEILYQGNNWRVVKDKKNDNRQSYAIIDGISYKLDPQASFNLNIQEDYDFYNFINRNSVHIDFDINELSIPHNREAIHYDDRTKEKIKTRVSNILSEINNTVNEKIKTAPNLWEAQIIWTNICRILNTSLKSVWQAPNGSLITIQSTEFFRCNNYHDNIKSFYKENYSHKIKSKHTCQLRIADNTIFVVQDEPMVSRLKLETLFDTYSKAESIQILLPTEIEDWQKVKYLDYLNPILLSTVQKKVYPKNTQHIRISTVNKIYNFTGSSWIPENIDMSVGEEIYVEFNRSKCDKWDDDVLKKFLKIFNITIYGIPTRFMNQISEDWIKLEDYLTDYLECNKDKINLEDYDFYNQSAYDFSQFAYHLNDWLSRNPNKVNDIIHPEMCEYMKLTEERKTLKFDKHYHYVYNKMNGTDAIPESPKGKRLKELHQICLEKFKLIPNIHISYSTNTDNITFNELIYYINAKP